MANMDKIKKDILKNKIKTTSVPNLNPKKSQEYPELKEAAETIKGFSTTPRGTRPQTSVRGDTASFGEKFKNPDFKKQFRKMQEKYKVTNYA